jgi:PAS domain S-box-containing protein
LVGLDGTLIKYNKAFKNLLGYTNAEIKNSPILKYVIFKEDRAAFIEILKTNPDSISSFESKLRTKSGAIKWLRWSATINKEAKVIVAVAKDITEQKNCRTKFRICVFAITECTKNCEVRVLE